ncbi:MAG: Rpn family recombination-promoting nuclease/putative transposase [Deferribacteraceae bacterium]|jgi:predicted transposase/invertase (TIGR01784 family)|nr:Rpn family recombination-promoting nuclease/putative transposase [Deferribacteraceae bacterium]
MPENREKPLLSSKLDIVFKSLMADPKRPELIRDFLQAVTDLPSEEYEKIEFPDTHLLPVFPELKLEVMDIRAIMKSGIEADVEIQLFPQEGIRERFLLYLIRPLILQLEKGSSYKFLKKVILIVITDFILLKEEE